MSKLTQIEKALFEIDPAGFQRLCDSYLDSADQQIKFMLSNGFALRPCRPSVMRAKNFRTASRFSPYYPFANRVVEL